MKPPSIEFMMIASRGIVLLLALITLAWAFMRWRRDTLRDAQRVFEQLDLVRAELLELQGQMGSAAKAGRMLKDHVAPIQSPASSYAYAPQTTAHAEHHEHSTRESQRIPAPAVETARPKSLTNAAPRGYEVAARLARNGASAEELMHTCALSRHEAELLVRLHAGMKSMQPPATTNNPAKNGASNAPSRAHSNLNQLKNIGRNAQAAKPASTTRPVSVRSPAPQRISLVG